MAVYKQKLGRTYTYDFEVEIAPGVRRRFRKSTGKTTEREVRRVEARARAEIEASITAPRPGRLPMITLVEAFGRFWEEKAQYEKNHKTVIGQLDRMLAFLGEQTMLHQVTNDQLTRYQTHRRKDGVSNRTINAEVPELLGRVYRRAEQLWGYDVGPPIQWQALKLNLPKPCIRALTRAEYVMLLRNLRSDYRPILRFAGLTGLRKSALIVRKSQLDWSNMVMSYPRKSKHTGDLGWLPITEAMATLLQREMERASESDFVFTYVCRKTRSGRIEGQRYPITTSGLREAVEPAVEAAAIPDWRLIHDLRHTAATQFLRKTQNLKAAQMLLGHSDISQTARYAHVMLDDLRRAMETP